jgi:tetratricopeptide (TPR) repeat protein
MASMKETWETLIAQRQGLLFVGREREIQTFRVNFVYKVPAYLIFAVHGPAGVGKSTLLSHYRAVAEEHGSVTARVGATQATASREQTILQTMVAVARQFDRVGAHLTAFEERYEAYTDGIQTVVNDPEAPGGLFDLLDAAEAEETWTAYLQETLGNPAQVDLLLSPVAALTEVFVRDLNAWAMARPLLLCFDDWERIGPHLKGWIQDVVHHNDIRTGIWLAIAGERPLDETWAPFRPVLRSIVLQPFTEDEVRVYLSAQGITDPNRITDVLAFSERIPALVSWLASARGGSAGDLALTPVDRYLRWLDDPARQEIVLRCAMARRLNADVVAAALGEPEAEDAFAWLADMPWLVMEGDHLRYHKALRQRIASYAQQQAPQAFQTAHTNLLAHYRACLAEMDGGPSYRDPAWRACALEALYHGLMVADVEAIQTGVTTFLRALRTYYPLAGEVVRTWEQAADAQLTQNAVTTWAELLTAGWQALEAEAWPEVLAFCQQVERRDDVSSAARQAIEGIRATAQARGTGAPPLPGSAPEIQAAPEAPAAETQTASEEGSAPVDAEEREAEQDVEKEDEALKEVAQKHTEAPPAPPSEEAPVSKMPAAAPPTPQKEAPVKEEPGELPEPVAPRPADSATQSKPPKELTPDAEDVTAADYNNRANVYLGMGEYEKAVAEYTKALQLDPDHVAARYNRGLALAQLGEPARAIAEFTEVIERRPSYAEAYYRRGLAHATLGDLDAAIADYDRAIELAPENAAMYNSRGNAHFKQGEQAAAIADYDRAIQLNPESAEFYLNRGLVHANQEAYKQAIADYNQAIALNPEQALAYNYRGLAYARQGEHGRALEDYEAAIRHAPGYAVAYNNQGLSYVRLEEYAQALDAYRRAVELDPEFAPAHYNAACAAALMGDVEAACPWLEQAIALRPRYREMAQGDPDFDKIRDARQFQALLHRP